VHVLSALATELGAVIGEMAVNSDQNEIAAAVVLLNGLPLDGAVITGDAIFTQRGICRHIRNRNGHYRFTVKDNQPELKRNIAEAFGDLSPMGPTSSITTLPALEITSGAASILSSSVALNLAGLTDACAGSLQARCKAARIQVHK
jgi:hypothetical protein